MARNLVKKMFSKIVVVILVLQFSVSVFAQNPPTDSLVSKPRRQITTIIFAGLAGAILGLSTLSFYGRPQEKLSNIAVGFAIGVISGAVYTTYQTATRPYDYMEAHLLEEELYRQTRPTFLEQAPGVAYQWDF
ncbi:MAG: hypothetical protein KDD50_13730 [Bdellovibrionales bacterium]|nr:hypothetical protein [Bdellovibrionales bacterium]